jgi:hypothetical protein
MFSQEKEVSSLRSQGCKVLEPGLERSRQGQATG